MATVTGLTAARMLEIEANTVPAVSKTVEKTILALASGAASTGTLLLGRAYRLDKLDINKACRLRLYISSLHRTIDADRPRDVDPSGDHGLIAEMIITPETLSLTLLPMPHGYVVSGITYYSLVNDGTTGDITFTLTEHVLEP